MSRLSAFFSVTKMLIFLVGFMGCGKTETAHWLSKKTGLPFLDTDGLIVRRSGLSIHDIFEQQGEAAFRRMESELIRQYPFPTDGIVSTGGGLPCHDENMAYLNTRGSTVYLDASPEYLFFHLHQPNATAKRPLLSGVERDGLKAHIQNLLEKRRPFYEQAAHRIILSNPKEKPDAQLSELVKVLGL